MLPGQLPPPHPPPPLISLLLKYILNWYFHPCLLHKAQLCFTFSFLKTLSRVLCEYKHYQQFHLRGCDFFSCAAFVVLSVGKVAFTDGFAHALWRPIGRPAAPLAVERFCSLMESGGSGDGAVLLGSERVWSLMPSVSGFTVCSLPSLPPCHNLWIELFLFSQFILL